MRFCLCDENRLKTTENRLRGRFADIAAVQFATFSLLEPWFNKISLPFRHFSSRSFTKKKTTVQNFPFSIRSECCCVARALASVNFVSQIWSHSKIKIHASSRLSITSSPYFFVENSKEIRENHSEWRKRMKVKKLLWGKKEKNIDRFIFHVVCPVHIIFSFLFCVANGTRTVHLREVLLCVAISTLSVAWLRMIF